MSQDLKKLLQQPPIPPSSITSFLKPSQMGALSETSKRTRASTRQAQAQIQQLDGSRVVNVQQFIRKLPSFPNLKTLVLTDGKINYENVLLFANRLTSLPKLKYVDLSRNGVSEATLKRFLSERLPTVEFKVTYFKENGSLVSGIMKNGNFTGVLLLYIL